MTIRQWSLCTLAVVGAVAWASSPAHALTMKECSAKYKAAQSAGTVKGTKWNDFRKAECGPTATAAPGGTPAAAPAAEKPARAPAARRTATPSATPSTPSNAVFPPTVSAKYSKESAGKARMHTCLDQYNANKTANGNGGLRWIQKGGGYYSECNKRLKS
jgi:hypothetical protein